MTAPAKKHIPEIKVKSYPGGMYVHRGEVYHYGGANFTSLEEATAAVNATRAIYGVWRPTIILYLRQF